MSDSYTTVRNPAGALTVPSRRAVGSRRRRRPRTTWTVCRRCLSDGAYIKQPSHRACARCRTRSVRERDLGDLSPPRHGTGGSAGTSKPSAGRGAEASRQGARVGREWMDPDPGSVGQSSGDGEEDPVGPVGELSGEQDHGRNGDGLASGESDSVDAGRWSGADAGGGPPEEVEPDPSRIEVAEEAYGLVGDGNLGYRWIPYIAATMWWWVLAFVMIASWPTQVWIALRWGLVSAYPAVVGVGTDWTLVDALWAGFMALVWIKLTRALWAVISGPVGLYGSSQPGYRYAMRDMGHASFVATGLLLLAPYGWLLSTLVTLWLLCGSLPRRGLGKPKAARLVKAISHRYGLDVNFVAYGYRMAACQGRDAASISLLRKKLGEWARAKREWAELEIMRHVDSLMRVLPLLTRTQSRTARMWAEPAVNAGIKLAHNINVAGELPGNQLPLK